MTPSFSLNHTWSSITGLDISNDEYDSDDEKLSGSLKLENFHCLEKLNCRYNLLTNELSLVKNNDLTMIYCWSNHISNLDLNENVKLIAPVINLSQNSQLTELSCSFNQINELIFPANNKIEIISCIGNLLTQLNWSRLDPNKLKMLLISDNNFSRQNLEFLEPFTNLSHLYLGTSNKELIQRDIDSGLEYLPSNLKSIIIDRSEPYRKEAKVNQLFSNLRPYRKESFSMKVFEPDFIEFYDLQEWRKANEKLIKKVKEEITSEVLLKEAKEQISQLQKELVEEKNRRLELERQLNNLQISDQPITQVVQSTSQSWNK
ncbi:PKD domain-containing protein [Rhizophagus irregularis DAOM 181602=DAOM 197198]|nr:PKD domain-containing protein [Rhizophagus irregularis DAOM 181602=DAOM 197198]